jgi:type IV secretion system protein VirB10
MASGEHDEPNHDPHASKISKDDPRLAIRRPTARRLRKGPALAIAFLLAVVVGTSIALAAVPRRRPPKDLDETFRPPAVPDGLLKAPPAAAPPRSATPAAPAEIRPSVPQTAAADAAPRAREDRGPYSAAGRRQQRIEAYWTARGAGILAPAGQMPVDTQDADILDEAGEPPRMSELALASEGSGVDPAAIRGRGAVHEDPNLQHRKNDFLQGGGGYGRNDDYLQTTLQRARSPYEVKAGSIIPGVLITGINSDLPGPVVAQVRENVYDTVTGNHLLIPQGAKLLASYDSMVAWGQERVLLCWHRLILPNGDSINLECMPAADLTGAAGLTDEVNEHWWRLISGAVIASLLTATTTAAAGSTQGYNPTIPQLWARGAATEIGQVGENITQRNMNIQPTITIRPGFSINVMVTKDMIIPPYELAHAAADAP